MKNKASAFLNLHVLIFNFLISFILLRTSIPIRVPDESRARLVLFRLLSLLDLLPEGEEGRDTGPGPLPNVLPGQSSARSLPLSIQLRFVVSRGWRHRRR